MYAIAILRYRRSLEEVLTVTDAHRAYLAGLKQRGILLGAGPFIPRSAGGLLLRVPDEGSAAALDAIRDGDPYTVHGMAQYEILPWDPVIGKEDLDKLG